MIFGDLLVILNVRKVTVEGRTKAEEFDAEVLIAEESERRRSTASR